MGMNNRKVLGLFLAVIMLAILGFAGITSGAGCKSEKVEKKKVAEKKPEAKTEKYQIKKGDTFWDISGRKLGNTCRWEEIQKLNPLVKPKELRPGSIIIIPVAAIKTATIKKAEIKKARKAKKVVVPRISVLPVFDSSNPNLLRLLGQKEIMGYKNPNRDPYKGSAGRALRLLMYSEEVAKLLEEKIKEKEFEWNYIRNGDKFLMVFGKNKMRFSQAGWKNRNKLLAVKKYSVTVDGLIYDLRYVLICGNWTRYSETSVPPKAEILPPEIKAEEIPPLASVEVPAPCETKELPVEGKYYEIIGIECDQLEAMGGIAIWVNNPDGNIKTHGKNIWAEIMYWKNLEQDCSSEYWYGFGAIASAYDYDVTHFPSEGNGWRAAGEVGLKRFYMSGIDEKGLEYDRSWQVKGRLGWEESEWKNPDTNKEIDQYGPVWGLYGEYIRELIDPGKISLVVQAESWFGFNQKVSGPAEWNLEPGSKTYASVFAGLDWKFAKDLTLRIGPGYDYQGWDRQDVFAPQAQIIWDLPGKNNGRLAFGFYGKFYHHLSSTFGLLGRYESGDLRRKLYSDHRVGQYKFVGKGIGNDSCDCNGK